MAERAPPTKANVVFDFIAVILILGIGIFVVYFFVTPRVGSASAYFLRFAYLVIIVIGVIIAINAFGRLVKQHLIPHASPSVGASLRLAFNVLAYVALLVVVFAYLGVNITAVLVGAGFLGIVLGLAAQTVLGNFLGALAIMFARPFVVGDRISIVTSNYGMVWTSYSHETVPAEHFGTVKEINLIYTHFEGDDGRPFVVANGIIVQALIRNYSQGGTREIRIRFPVPRTLDFPAYREKALATLSEVGQLRRDHTRLAIASIDPKSYDVVIQATAASGDDEQVRSEMLRRLLAITPPLA